MEIMIMPYNMRMMMIIHSVQLLMKKCSINDG